MKKSLLLFLLLISCKSSYLDLDKTLHFESGEKLYLNSSVLLKYKIFKIQNIEYRIAVNKSDKIKYISTRDTNFKTSNLRINNLLKEIPNYKASLKYDENWKIYYIKVNKEWYSGFNEDTKPNEDSKIGYFFKYNFPKKTDARKLFLNKYEFKE